MNRGILTSGGFAVPQSYVTKGKQRLKQYQDTVYLQNGDEFEIELFNPQRSKVLAKIELNGKPIGSGIVLRPGERVFLERYIDEAKKFLFETYTVNGNNDQVKNAIVDNGTVAVYFYDEYVPARSITLNSTSTNFYNSGTSTPAYGWTTTDVPVNMTYTTAGSEYTRDLFLYNTANLNQTPRSRGILDKKTIETGRVEKGSKSDQSFTTDSTTFCLYHSYVNVWKILPKSQKPVVREDLATYCTECGAKRKKDTFKFCPHCGTKY